MARIGSTYEHILGQKSRISMDELYWQRILLDVLYVFDPKSLVFRLFFNQFEVFLSLELKLLSVDLSDLVIVQSSQRQLGFEV